MRHWQRTGYGVTSLSGFLILIGALCGSHAAAVNVPASTNSPGLFSPGQTPQIVLLTFDDSVTSDSCALVQQVLTNRFNPNGQAIKATFFVSLDSSYDPSAIRRLYDAGHEIAVHTMTHATDESTGLVRWRQEIAGAKRTIATLSGIPDQDIAGFRAPFLKPNDSAFRVLAERGFLYDSSFSEGLSGLSKTPSGMIWPYTLDAGLKQSAQPERMPLTNYPGLFEIPLWAQFSNTTAVASMDPPDALSSNGVVALWQTNFLSHYNGNRAPYGVFLHATTTNQWLSSPANSAWRVGALQAFVDWALAQPDTWFITCQDLLAYMREPVSSAAAATNRAFQTPVRIPFPAASVSSCPYPDSHTLNVCGACPPAAPRYTNALLRWVPVSIGTVTLNILSQDTSYAWCSMTVSNNAAQRIYDWSARFTAAGGAVQSMYDASVAQTGSAVTASARPYNRQIGPGAARVLAFRVSRSGGAVAFSDARLLAYGLGPQPIRISLQRLAAPDRWRLSWDDAAYLYEVESTTNLLAPSEWTSVTNGLGQPEFTQPDSGNAPRRFYRVEGTLY